VKAKKNPDAPFYRAMAVHEKRILQVQMEESKGVRTEAAKALGISYRSLLWKLDQHGLNAKEKV
jgi:DNA-binding NtrC family response regulator